MKNSLTIFIFIYSLNSSFCGPPVPQTTTYSSSTEPSESFESDTIEYAFGGGIYLPSAITNDSSDPDSGYSFRLQTVKWGSDYFNFVTSLDFSISGTGLGNFSDSNGQTLNSIYHDYYSVNYLFGLRYNFSPTFFIIPYMGVSGAISISTFQFDDQISDDFPKNQRGLMYGFDAYGGLDIFLSGDKDDGWGFRIEGNMVYLYPYNDFVFGSPSIKAYNVLLLFVISN